MSNSIYSDICNMWAENATAFERLSKSATFNPDLTYNYNPSKLKTVSLSPVNLYDNQIRCSFLITLSEVWIISRSLNFQLKLNRYIRNLIVVGYN